MSRPTESACPVCAEPLSGQPERCFRCQTALGRWWAFEDALQALEPGRPPAPGPAGTTPGRMLAMALVSAARGAAGVIALRPAPRAPLAAVPSPPAPSPSAPPAPAVLSYRVQRGDSLWRIASAVTGDGRRWRDLWPEHRDGE